MNIRPWIVLCAVTLASCHDPADTARVETPAAAMPAARPLTTARAIDGWLGHWTGPEGTALDLAKNGDGEGYRITITNLDGPRVFEGSAAKNHIEFVRDGKPESIRSGSGKDTRMKWLLEKADCLVIRDGEGYCRD